MCSGIQTKRGAPTSDHTSVMPERQVGSERPTQAPRGTERNAKQKAAQSERRRTGAVARPRVAQAVAVGAGSEAHGVGALLEAAALLGLSKRPVARTNSCTARATWRRSLRPLTTSAAPSSVSALHGSSRPRTSRSARRAQSASRSVAHSGQWSRKCSRPSSSCAGASRRGCEAEVVGVGGEPGDSAAQSRQERRQLAWAHVEGVPVEVVGQYVGEQPG